MGIENLIENATYTPMGFIRGEMPANHRCILCFCAIVTTEKAVDLPSLYCISKLSNNTYISINRVYPVDATIQSFRFLSQFPWRMFTAHKVVFQGLSVVKLKSLPNWKVVLRTLSWYGRPWLNICVKDNHEYLPVVVATIPSSFSSILSSHKSNFYIKL